METIFNFTYFINLQRLIIDYRDNQFLHNITRFWDFQFSDKPRFFFKYSGNPFSSEIQICLLRIRIIANFLLLHTKSWTLISSRLLYSTCSLHKLFQWLLFEYSSSSDDLQNHLSFTIPSFSTRNGFRVIQYLPSTDSYRSITTKNPWTTYFTRWKYHQEDCTSSW